VGNGIRGREGSRKKEKGGKEKKGGRGFVRSVLPKPSRDYGWGKEGDKKEERRKALMASRSSTVVETMGKGEEG